MLTIQSRAQEIKLYAKNKRAGESHLWMRQSTTQKMKKAHLGQLLRKNTRIQLLVECQDAYLDSVWSHSLALMTDSRVYTCERKISDKHESWIRTSCFLKNVYSSSIKVPCLWNGTTCKKPGGQWDLLKGPQYWEMKTLKLVISGKGIFYLFLLNWSWAILSWVSQWDQNLWITSH